MNTLHLVKHCTALAAASVLLVACGGGDGPDEDLVTVTDPGVLTVTRSTIPELDGAYGSGPLAVSEVGKLTLAGKDAPANGDTELCAFSFDGAVKDTSPAVAFGYMGYLPSSTTLYRLVVNVDGHEYASDNPTDTFVVRNLDHVRIDRQTLLAADGSGATIRVSGTVPMLPNRPIGC